MTTILELTPVKCEKIIDLVSAAGVDVSDWANFKGGPSKATSNPKYCYEWAFLEPGKVVVINLWHKPLKETDGLIFQSINMRKRVDSAPSSSSEAVWAKRAKKFDTAIQTAYREKLPLRVVICDGEMRDVQNPDAKASRFKNRLLDPVTWAVTNYDWSTGHCTVTRGARPDCFADQFSIPQEQEQPVEQRIVSGRVFVRNPDVRRRVLQRAKGKCEWCAELGFIMADGRIYLETHHVIPLAECGPDTESNVAALCPNHHQEAHHGANSSEMRETLLRAIEQTIVGRTTACSGSPKKLVPADADVI